MKCLVDKRHHLTASNAKWAYDASLHGCSSKSKERDNEHKGGGGTQNSSRLHGCTSDLCRKMSDSDFTASGAAAHLMNLPSLSYFLPNVTGEYTLQKHREQSNSDRSCATLKAAGKHGSMQWYTLQAASILLTVAHS